MMSEPRFWSDDTLSARAIRFALAPISGLYHGAQRARRALARPVQTTAPIICIGNASVGGVGKTPFALMIAERLIRLGANPAFLSRGYGGTKPGPLLVDPQTHDAQTVGDEPLLLARTAPTIIARRRPDGAALAARHGDVIVMDDGFQNPTVRKAYSFLLARRDEAPGAALVFPAGRLREPMRAALQRADAFVSVVESPMESGVRAAFPGPCFKAWVEPAQAAGAAPVYAFCGIGAPARFFRFLERGGHVLTGRRAFPDHHPYRAEDMIALRAAAGEARLVTTEKDFVRIPAALRDGVEALPVVMRVTDTDLLDAVLSEALNAFDADLIAGEA